MDLVYKTRKQDWKGPPEPLSAVPCVCRQTFFQKDTHDHLLTTAIKHPRKPSCHMPQAKSGWDKDSMACHCHDRDFAWLKYVKMMLERGPYPMLQRKTKLLPLLPV